MVFRYVPLRYRFVPNISGYVFEGSVYIPKGYRYVLVRYRFFPMGFRYVPEGSIYVPKVSKYVPEGFRGSADGLNLNYTFYQPL